MPPLKHPSLSETLELPTRPARIAAETDVLVVGGGPAGMGAALGAASEGVRVILAERYGFLGGNATAALVMPFMSYHTQSAREEVGGSENLFPPDHGPGEPVIKGALSFLIKRLVRSGGAIPPSPQTGYVVPFDPEVFKWVALDLLDEAGVEFLFHSFASGVIGRGQLEGVIFETKSGPIVIRATVVVDCTGDGDVAVQAGAPYQIGDEKGWVQPMTLMFLIMGFDRMAFGTYVRDHPDQWLGVHGLWELISQAHEAGELVLPREDILFFGTTHEQEVIVNSTRITKVLGTDVWDLTYAERQGRRQMRQIARFLMKHVPGFEKSYISQSGATVGVRETRRITGEYQLTVNDVLSGRRFEDGIARCSYPLDIHNSLGTGTLLKRLPAGQAYDIPLRCLLPLGTENLLVAGRCISGSREALSSYRIMPVSVATGQAAGLCAALSIQGNCPPRRIPLQHVRERLAQQNRVLESRE
ncbi:MAG TPA: FAD-dependent oxidoreductase [Thermodesulfobacteriota bacterium]|nr:FAD-dependent oxidoreductase [Thermodesulfobacteriota bacterium]